MHTRAKKYLHNFLELNRQQSLLKSSLENRLKKIMEHKLFINGPEVQELEKKLADYAGVPFAYCTSSGTNALIISLLVAGVKPGDEVITSPLSFGATAMSILVLGAVPVFVDIEPDTGLMAVSPIEAAITKNTKAILPVSLYGQTCDMDPINDIAKKHNLAVIEDACQSFGADYKGKKSGSLSLIGSVSFSPIKALGAYGNGGCVFTKDKELGKKIHSIRNQGQSKNFFYEFIGINALMNTFQAGVLLEKFKLFDEELKIRQKKANKYDQVFQTGQWEVKPLQVKKDRASTISFYILKSKKREQILKEFNKFEKPLPIYYPSALFDQPAIKPRCKIHGDPYLARSFAKQVFSLPCHAYLTDKEQDDIIQLMKKANANLEN